MSQKTNKPITNAENPLKLSTSQPRLKSEKWKHKKRDQAQQKETHLLKF